MSRMSRGGSVKIIEMTKRVRCDFHLQCTVATILNIPYYTLYYTILYYIIYKYDRGRGRRVV